MVKYSLPLVLVCAGALCTAGVLPAFADSITLNSGEQLEGKVVSETDSQVTVEVKVAAGITDQRVLAKSDIKSVTKVAPDEVAYESLKYYKVGPSSFAAASYDNMILALNGFLEKFPDSTHAQEIRQAIDTLKQDQTRVLAGDLKWNSRWYTAKEAADQKEELGAAMTLSTMKDQIAHNDLIGALNTFDRLEQTYPGTSAYPDAVEQAIPLIPRLVAAVDRAAAVAKIQEQQFTDGVALSKEPEQSQMRAVHKNQIAAAEAAVAAADRAGVKWKPLLPLTPKSTDAIKKTAAAETTRLSALPLAKMRQSLAVTNQIPEALAGKNLADAEAKLKQAQTLWAANATAKKLAPTIEAAIKAAKLAAAATPKPTPKVAPTPMPKQTPKPTPKPTPTPTPKAWYNPF